MGKKFLDIIGDAYEDDVLSEVIPVKKAASSSRKKRFVESLGESLPVTTLPKREKATPNRRMSLLDAMEEALDSRIFDEIVPPSMRVRRQTPAGDLLDTSDIEVPFSTMITKQVLDRAREIASLKGIRVKDVLNIALRIYVEREVAD
ncbi:MAG: hypothetical protein SF053_06300 [Bacteroidia bacterium]|nr:hypothetical protein [Bacteroidia bacterium]